eukprot:SAG11_NODE_28843_length_317_cov_0.715596_1_plen_31_part_01
MRHCSLVCVTKIVWNGKTYLVDQSTVGQKQA